MEQQERDLNVAQLRKCARYFRRWRPCRRRQRRANRLTGWDGSTFFALTYRL